MKWPDFLVIGAAKCGTTTLHHHLRAHPGLFLPERKEPKFFAFDGRKPDYSGRGDEAANRDVVTEVNDYQRLFLECAAGQVAGEVSPVYLYEPRALERVRERIPSAKIIAILRQPAERAFSSWLHLVRTGRETEMDFRKALLEEDRLRGQSRALLWHYADAGYYHRQLQPWFEAFPRERIQVHLQEDLNADPARVMSALYEFLGVDPDFTPAVEERHNVSHLRRRGALARFIEGENIVKRWIKPVIPEPIRRRLRSTVEELDQFRPELDPRLKEELTERFREDILRLQDLLERDLTRWLRGK